MIRQCPSCKEILYLSSVIQMNGTRFLKCSHCNTLVRFRKEKEEYIEYQKPKYSSLQILEQI